MKISKFLTVITTTFALLTAIPQMSYGDTSSSSQPFSSSSSKPLPPFPTAPAEAAPKETLKLPPLKQVHLPTMMRPFGMPGVVGVVNNVWQNSDYLGYLSHNIPVTVELLVGKNVPVINSPNIEKALTNELIKENIINSPQSKEGPIFPFLHLLVMVYATGDDRFVIFENLRLFEEVVVVRKRFSPAGFWQGITWENQDVNLANAANLQTQVEAIASKLAALFVARYHDYNKDIDKEPQGSMEEPADQPSSY